MWLTLPLLVAGAVRSHRPRRGRRADRRRRHVRRRRPGVGHSAAGRRAAGSTPISPRSARRPARTSPAARCCTNPTPRAAAFALLRTFVHPGIRPALAIVVLVLAAAAPSTCCGAIGDRSRRSSRDGGPVRRLPPAVSGHVVRPLCAAARARGGVSRRPGVALVSVRGGAGGRRADLDRRRGHRQPGARRLRRRAEPDRPRWRPCRPKRAATPGALAMHQTFVRPLEAEDVGIDPLSCRRRRGSSGSSSRSIGRAGRPARSGSSPIRCAAIWRLIDPASRAIRPSSRGRSWRGPRSAACGRRRCAGIACRPRAGSPKRAGR